MPAPPPPDDDAPTSDASQQPQDRPEELEGAEGAGDAIALETADAVQEAGQEEVVRDVPTLIADAANRWGLDPQTMLRIAWCESRWDPNARGPGGAAGVFQIVPQTWSWASAAAGMGGASPFDAAANVETASWLMKAHGPREWSCR